MSGSKTQKILSGKSRSIVHVVRPEWITDSIDAGKRLPERSYSVLRNDTNKTLFDVVKAGSSPDAPIELE